MMHAIADIAVAPDHKGVLVMPRIPRQRMEVRALLERALSSRIRATPSGFELSYRSASQLAASGSAGLFKWTADASRYVENRELISARHPHILERIREIKSCEIREVKRLLGNSEEFRVLDAHQLRNVAAMTLPESWGLCVFDEQGAGKTVTFIYAFDLLCSNDLADICLIVAPKSMVAEWPQDFARFKRDLYKTVVLTGAVSTKMASLSKGGEVFITNFETVIAMERELTGLLRRFRDRAVLAVDESFFIKNPDAQRTQALKRLREWCGRAFVLCGTPAPNAARDIIEQVNFVDCGATFDDFSIPEEEGAARAAIADRLNARGGFVRNLKRDVLPDLPPKAIHRIVVPLAPVQKQLYLSTLTEFKQDLLETSDLAFRRNLVSFLARRSAMLQLCSNPAAVVDGYTETPAKFEALDSLLAELIRDRGEKIVLWSFYTKTIDALMVRYGRYQPVRYDGQVADLTHRRAAVKNFQEDDETMLFIGNPAAAGAGLTLHRSRTAIYESFSNQAAHYLQSIDRIHRRGQLRCAQYLVLLCEGTLEMDEYERLVRKEAAGNELLGDSPGETPTRESMLAEVLNSLGRLTANA
jgi:SNF2 family DNA or RNA helicase